MQIPQANGGEGKEEEGKMLVTSEPKELLSGAWVICDCTFQATLPEQQMSYKVT